MSVERRGFVFQLELYNSHRALDIVLFRKPDGSRNDLSKSISWSLSARSSNGLNKGELERK